MELLVIIVNLFIWLIFFVIRFGFLVVFKGILGDVDLFVKWGGVDGWFLNLLFEDWFGELFWFDEVDIGE